MDTDAGFNQYLVNMPSEANNFLQDTNNQLTQKKEEENLVVAQL